MSAVQADALRLPIADHTVDLIVTSPPYFGLRSYANGGIGEEPTPAEYVDALIAATREMVRVLKPSGSIFVNLGDKFAGSQQQNSGRQNAMSSAEYWQRSKATGRPKSLMGLPWRYAIRCVDELGLILRRDIIWDKPNGLPESVTDRCRSSHEYWFHFTTQPRYYSAIDEIREPYSSATIARYAAGYVRYKTGAAGAGQTANGVLRADDNGAAAPNPLGKLPGSVWTIPTEPLHLPDELGVEHYAAFPSEWPRRLILGWSPREICTACGEGRRPITSVERIPLRPSRHKSYGADNHSESHTFNTAPLARIIGYGCCLNNDAPTTPGIVLDPFGGTGTTAAVAQTLGRIGISVDLAHDYARAAVWRANDPGLRAKVLRVDKAKPVQVGQVDLFDIPRQRSPEMPA